MKRERERKREKDRRNAVNPDVEVAALRVVETLVHLGRARGAGDDVDRGVGVRA